MAEDGFDRWVEELCSKYFKEKGRRSIPPGVYFRMLMIGYFEGIMSERVFAHLCETGGLRRFTVRGLENCQKRYLIQALAYNLGVLMRRVHGFGTPRSPRERALLAYLAFCWLIFLSMLVSVVFSEKDE